MKKLMILMILTTLMAFITGLLATDWQPVLLDTTTKQQYIDGGTNLGYPAVWNEASTNATMATNQTRILNDATNNFVVINDHRNLNLDNVNSTNLTVNGTNVMDFGGVPSAWEIGIVGWLVPRNAFSYDPRWTTNSMGWLVPK
jgi:hypothetical protein